MIFVKVQHNDVDFALRLLKQKVQKAVKNLQSDGGGKKAKGSKTPGNVNTLYLASKGSGAMKAFTSGKYEHGIGRRC